MSPRVSRHIKVIRQRNDNWLRFVILTALDGAVDVSNYVRTIDTWRARPIGV
jgi:hypothetical protein